MAVTLQRTLGVVLLKSPKSILLLGPRQVGKSTLIQSLKPDLEIQLAQESVFLEFSHNPSELENQIQAIKPKTIFIDEIQRLPSLLNTIQAIVDKNKKLKFYLTGSSARKLKQGKANLLPGRIFSYELGPLVSAELGYEMNVNQAMETGTLPEIYFSKDRAFQEKLLRTYSATYLKEEIQMEALVRNLEGFSRFIHVAAASSGKFLDYSKIAKQAKISRQNTPSFFEILEDTMIARKISPFLETKDVDIVKHPRYFFFDTGVLNGLLGNFIASEDRKGMLFEHLFVNQVYHSAKAKDLDIEIYGFRTRGGLEIDFLVRVKQELWAIEVKCSSTISSSDLNGLQSFKKYYKKPYYKMVVVPKGVAKEIDGVQILPLQKALQSMGL